MAPHQKRVIYERQELDEKLQKLGSFLFGDIFNSLHEDERTRLLKQNAYMTMYRDILDARIAAF